MPAWQESMDRWFREHHGVAPLAALLPELAALAQPAVP